MNTVDELERYIADALRTQAEERPPAGSWNADDYRRRLAAKGVIVDRRQARDMLHRDARAGKLEYRLCRPPDGGRPEAYFWPSPAGTEKGKGAGKGKRAPAGD